MENVLDCGRTRRQALKQAMSTVVPWRGLKFKFLDGANLSLAMEILEGQEAQEICSQYSWYPCTITFTLEAEFSEAIALPSCTYYFE